MLAELRAMMLTRPGGGAMQAVTELIRSGGGRTADGAKDRWPPEGERVVRQTLLLFYVYLFADMDECPRHTATMSAFADRNKVAFDAFADDPPSASGTLPCLA